jgi:hypothetical protein
MMDEKDGNPVFDAGQRVSGEPRRLLYSSAANELNDLKQSVAAENLALTAGAKARRQRIIGITVFLVILALFTVYAIIQILGR